MIAPFDTTGVTRGPDGIKRYDGLPPSLVHTLRDTVDRDAGREALAETGDGPRLTYAELWDRAARVPVTCAPPAWDAVTGCLRSAPVSRHSPTPEAEMSRARS